MSDKRLRRGVRIHGGPAYALKGPVPSAVEALESRLLLSTYTVTNLNDSGAGSLRDAIEQANASPGPDTIDFATDLSGTITLGGTQLEISDDLTIDGPSASLLIVSGNHASGVFQVDEKVTAAFSGITISGGNEDGGAGGGIVNGGTLTITESVISGNSAGDGGGISNGGTLTITNSAVSSNSATGPGGIDEPHGDGGGISNGGTLTITNCDISDNSGKDVGGGISNDGTLVLTNSSLHGNNAAAYGGGIWNTATLTITNSSVSGNYTNPDVDSNGGGISNWAGTLTMTKGTVSNNSAGYSGGGIYNVFGVSTIIDSTLSDNSAFLGGGIDIDNADGSATVTNSTISGNSAFDAGGGISNGGVLVLRNSTISNNVGGGLYNATEATAYNSIIAGNKQGDIGYLPLDSPSSHNLIGGDPELAPLSNYGGPTQTMPPLPGSPAIDAGSNALALGPDGEPLVIDQRGFPRVVNGAVDIGAVESQSFLPGDANLDGKVDFADLVIVARNYGKTSGVTWVDGDFNGDGSVGFDDLVILARNYGHALPQPAGTALLATFTPTASDDSLSPVLRRRRAR